MKFLCKTSGIILLFLVSTKHLDDSVDDINSFLTTYGVKIKKGDVHEHASTFGSVFDTDIGDIFEDHDELCGVMVRGFIFEEEDLKA